MRAGLEHGPQARRRSKLIRFNQTRPPLQSLRVQGRARLGTGVRNAGPSLRSGCPVLLSAGVAPNNSLRSLRSLAQTLSAESVDEAREYACRPQRLRCSAAHTHPGAQPGKALQPPAVVRQLVDTPTLLPQSRGWAGWCGQSASGAGRDSAFRRRVYSRASTTRPSNVFESGERSEWGELFDATQGRSSGGQSVPRPTLAPAPASPASALPLRRIARRSANPARLTP